MRADRLLSILMILQSRGKATARELALELEVSERTIYRDIIALSIAGIPVYTESGPGGGIYLLESYRTTLTGLNEDEIQALFMLSIPSPLAELGVSKQLQAALLKITASLPQSGGKFQDQVMQRVLLDWEGWFEAHQSVPHLQTIHKAVWAQNKISLVYTLAFETTVERIVEPLGLVAKANTWFLVFLRDGYTRILGVDQVLDVKVLDQTFERPTGFDLGIFWAEWRKEFEANRAQCIVIARFAPSILTYLPVIFGNTIQRKAQNLEADQDGWIEMQITFENIESARGQILSLGGAVVVISPNALRLSVKDYAQQVLNVYAESRDSA